MKEIRDALLRMVRAGTKVKKLQEAYLKAELNDNMLYDIYGDIADAISAITGEKAEEFQLSTTCLALTVPYLNDEQRVNVLMGEYKNNHPEQPAPQFLDREKIWKDAGRKLGYSYQTPEGDWS